MNKESISTLMGIAVVPIGLAMVLLALSMLIGWNLLMLFLFWFVITPGLAIYLPTIFSGDRDHFFMSMLGLVIFYAAVVFLIYDHYQTDYFRVMMLSCVLNLILAAVVKWRRMPRLQAQ